MSQHKGPAGGVEIAPGLTGLKELGGGISYEAWLAFDERLLCPVVVKMIRPELVDDPGTLEAFRRELDILASLNHPGLARLLSYDDQFERPFFVIEHIDGPTLSSLISRHGHLPEHQWCAVAVDLCSTLHYLHGMDLCHLDIKPSNIVTGAPAKMIDFSLAMSSAQAAAIIYPIGTDEYMAPEQCEPGVRGAMGPATDVFSMGATLYRAAAGFRAWEREPRWQQLTEKPKPLPQFINPRIAEIIFDCLVEDPAQRPTPADLVDRLDPVIAALPKARLSGFSVRL